MAHFQFLKDVGGTLKFTPILAGDTVIPTAATVSILTISGSDMPDPIIDVVPTIATNGELSTPLSAANAVNGGIGFKVIWKWTVGGIVNITADFFDIVLNLIYQTLTVQVLKDHLKDLDELDEKTVLQKKIDHTFNTIFISDINNMARREDLLLRPDQLRKAHMYLTIWNIADTERQEEGDIWDIRFDKYENLYISELQEVKVLYDHDKDSLVDSGETQSDLTGEFSR